MRCPRSPVDNKSLWAQVSPWCQCGDKSSPEPMMTQLTDAICHGIARPQASFSQWYTGELTSCKTKVWAHWQNFPQNSIMGLFEKTWRWHEAFFARLHIFSCDQAALQMVFSVCPSVCPSVTPFWLCSHHRIIMKFSGVITNDQNKVHAKGQGQRSRSQRSQPNLTVSGL